VLAVLGTSGCLDGRVLALDGDDEPTTSTGAITSGVSTSLGTSTVSSSTTASADDTVSMPGTDSTGSVFVVPKEDLGFSFMCDIFTQNCPVGEKCTAWANDGSGSWNATKCVPIADDPVGVGEPCQVEGSGTTGIDDCELGAMCWDVDPKTNEGVCRGFCLGQESDAHCENPHEACSFSGSGAIVLCLPICDPLEPSCAPGQACYPIVEVWMCAPDASGDLGAYGDPCEFINVCDPGLICLDSSAVPPGQACEGANGCCTEVCDITDPAGDLQCAGAAEGQTCQPWYEEGTGPAVLEHVGACALPA